ncbi:MAG: hypothetical protein ABIK09_19025 [Pseudomonadota bacterium]
MKNRKIILVVVVLVLVFAIAISGAVWLTIGGVGVARTHRKAMTFLPRETVVMLTVDVEAVGDQLFKELEPILGFRLDDAETRKELGAYFEGRIGFDPFKVRRMVVFGLEDGPAMILHGDFEFDPFVGRTKEYEGHTMTLLGQDLWATPIADALAVGMQDRLRLLIDVDRGEHKALEGTDEGGVHGAMLDTLGDGVALVTVAFNEDLSKNLGEDFMEGAVFYAAGLRFGVRDGTVLLKADAATRKALLERLESLKGDARKGINAARERLDQLDLLPAVGVVIADRHMDEIFEKLTPKEDGEFLRLDLDTQAASLLYLSAMASTAAGFVLPMAIEHALD